MNGLVGTMIVLGSETYTLFDCGASHSFVHPDAVKHWFTQVEPEKGT